MFFLTTHLSNLLCRDIKSKNILVKKDGSCCIADFGLAVRYDRERNMADVGAPNARVGTVRYMAPENLDRHLEPETTSFNIFLQTDIYSLSLVFWEVARRTTTGEKVVRKTDRKRAESESVESWTRLQMSCDDYQPPFFEWVNQDPTIEDMHTVVCKKVRDANYQTLFCFQSPPFSGHPTHAK